MAITATEARRDLFGLMERVNLDHTDVEIASKRSSAELMSKGEHDSSVETATFCAPQRTRSVCCQPWNRPAGVRLPEYGLIEP
ncbi:antitoxin YefM [Arthrobacter alpinus]|uniref:Antitoxin YefM n=2 Tax=Arthrobacter alpinus TaxID=656366 RepID=A0A1H5I151_9MICC|nr:antitoxin YefM [Arthrobacter alpinus]